MTAVKSDRTERVIAISVLEQEFHQGRFIPWVAPAAFIGHLPPPTSLRVDVCKYCGRGEKMQKKAAKLPRN